MRKRNEDGTCYVHGDERCLDPLCGASVLAHELRQAETYANADGSNNEHERNA